MSRVLFFLLLCIPIWIFHGWLFLFEPMPDFVRWANTAEHFWTQDEPLFLTTIYPGTAPLLIANIFHTVLDVNFQVAFALSLSLITASAIAGAAMMAKKLFPTIPWWIALTAILTCNVMYLLSTPPTAVLLPILCLVWLLAWQCHTEHFSSRWHVIILGCLLGFSATVRWDFTAATTAFICLFFLLHKQWRVVALMIVSAVPAFILFDPYLWFMPVRHIADVVHQFFFHYRDYADTHTISLLSLVLRSPWAFAAFFLGVAALHPRFPMRPVPRSLLAVWLLYTVTGSIIIWFSVYRTSWYFFPFLMLWECMLPLFVMTWARQVRFFTPAAIATVFVVTYILMIAHYLSLPQDIFVLTS